MNRADLCISLACSNADYYCSAEAPYCVDLDLTVEETEHDLITAHRAIRNQRV